MSGNLEFIKYGIKGLDGKVPDCPDLKAKENAEDKVLLNNEKKDDGTCTPPNKNVFNKCETCGSDLNVRKNNGNFGRNMFGLAFVSGMFLGGAAVAMALPVIGNGAFDKVSGNLAASFETVISFATAYVSLGANVAVSTDRNKLMEGKK